MNLGKALNVQIGKLQNQDSIFISLPLSTLVFLLSHVAEKKNTYKKPPKNTRYVI